MLILGVPWSDALTGLSAPFIIIALVQTQRALNGQRIADELQTVLALWERFDEHWGRFLKAQNDTDKKFEFGQLATYYEIACGLFCNRILTSRAADTLDEHLSEILPRMQKNEGFAARFDALRSTPDTFANIKCYCERLERKSKGKRRAFRFGFR